MLTTDAQETTFEVRHLQRINRELAGRNTKLVELLKSSRDKLALLNEQMESMAQPPSTYGVVLDAGYQDSSADVFTGGRRMRLMVSPEVAASELVPGALVRLGESSAVVEVCGTQTTGQLATVSEILDGSRILISTTTSDNAVLTVSQALREPGAVKPGDTVLYDSRALMALEVVAHTEINRLALEEIPDVTYTDIGGLDEQIEMIHDAVELPFTHPELYKHFDLHPPKGVLLYGPPGCGKTLIAKAVANSLSARIGEVGSSYFINVKGPELLNKFVGETERMIRLIFERARELASEGRPVIVFFDEMESIFRTRGSGRSSDMETTVVPQLLAELDGVESVANVIVIGATNREELIDPAILRPGRLDVKIKVSRPNREQAHEIFSRYITDTIPLACEREELIHLATEELFTPRPYVVLTLSNGCKETLYTNDFVSGAMIANIVDRAKKLAIKQHLADPQDTVCGVSAEHLREAVRVEMKENEDLPNTSNPDEWARITGRHGARVVEAQVVLS
ncbi:MULTISPECIES: proteasome ATPase [unclassified Corynebacterium]|uniref:proteasome ATPase n=1 Tax=unclassified Corynebacterium TaxID=2624378 RepID=UPI001C46F982|nr:proteasome ATPase [Corynebacterium sp. TAE3-ERU30]MBV7302596.1 proteasome ATPase [Corynebacterium sp. TAE3-ERU2]